MATVRLVAKEYSDTAYVEGVFRRDCVMERALYYHCKEYFERNYKGVLFVYDDDKEDVFDDAFVTLWENILNRKIYVKDNVLKGKDGKTFTSSLTTYFMGIAKLKNLEWARKNRGGVTLSEEEVQCFFKNMISFGEFHEIDHKEIMLRIIEICLSHISERCGQILKMFYYEEMTLDAIMKELPSFTSKDALKTNKHKCMENLRSRSMRMYETYLKT